MKLLEAIKLATIKDGKLLEDIYYTLEDRKDVLEGQEPYGSSDYFYEKWEEKYDEFCSIFENFESIVEELGILDDNEYEELNLSDNDLIRLEKELNDFKSELEIYQFEYGGLKRLNV